METKLVLYNKCLTLVEERISRLQHLMKDIQEALLSETKSSAGDKHETGRAMLQLEREKLGNQLSGAFKLYERFVKINYKITSEVVTGGSVVYTSNANYYLGVSVGEIHLEKERFFAIATNTPIGKLLLGSRVGDTISFRGEEFQIEKII